MSIKHFKIITILLHCSILGIENSKIEKKMMKTIKVLETEREHHLVKAKQIGDKMKQR